MRLSLCLVISFAAACVTTSARGEPSTRLVLDNGAERLAEDVARDLLERDDKASYRRVVDEFADTRSRGPATIALSRLLLAEKQPASAAEAQRWLEKYLFEEPTDDLASEARSLLATAQLAQGDARSAAPAIASLVDKLPEHEKGPALMRLGRELVSAGNAENGVRALLQAWPRVSASERAAVEQEVVFALDMSQSSGGVSFSAVSQLHTELSSSSPFADEVLLWKLARIKTHLRKDDEASRYATSLVQKYPSSRYAAAAKQLKDDLTVRVQVNSKAIGIILPLSGEFAAYGKRALIAIRLAFNLPLQEEEQPEIEVDPETGEERVKPRAKQQLAGTIGVPGGLKLIVKDSAGSATRAQAAVRELVEKDHVIAIIGDILIDTSLPIALACEDYGVPLLSLSRREGVPEAGPWTFRLALTPKKQARALVDYAVDGLKFKRFAIMYPRHAFGTEAMTYFWDALDEREAEVTAIEAYAHDQTTFTEEAKSLVGRGMVASSVREVTECRAEARKIENDYRRKKALEGCNDKAKPIIDFEAIFVPDSFRAVSYVVPALISEDVLLTTAKFAVEAYKKATGNDKVRPVQLLGVNTLNDPALSSRFGRTIDGAVFVDAFDPTDQTPLVQRFIEGFGKAMRSKPTLIEAQIFDAARLMGALIEGQLPQQRASGSAGQKPQTRQQVKQALDDVKDFAGVTGPISFDEAGDSIVPVMYFKLEREKVERSSLADLVKGAG